MRRTLTTLLHPHGRAIVLAAAEQSVEMDDERKPRAPRRRARIGYEAVASGDGSPARTWVVSTDTVWSDTERVSIPLTQ